MRAAQYDTFTDDVTAFVVREVAKPQPKDGEILVKVNAASVNPIDGKVMSGGMKGAGWRCDLPFTLGYDVSGVVEELGDRVDDFAVGDDVWGVNWGQNKHDDDDGNAVGGTFAEYIALPASKLSKKPSDLSHSRAAALGLVGTTAYQLVESSEVKEGDRVLVLGGSTAVGMLVIQLLKLRGAIVITTSSPRTRSFVETLGPDQIIDYTAEDWSTVLASVPVEHVIDTVGVENDFHKAAGITKEGATYLSIASFDVGFDPNAHQPHYSRASFLCLSNSRKVQDILASLVTDGKLRTFIETEVPFSQEGVNVIMTKQKAGKSLGKNVLLF